MLKFFYKFFKIIIYISPLFILIHLIYLDLVPSGTVSFHYNIKKDSPVITNFFPANRLSDPLINKDNEYYQEINQEPVYFETRLSQKFDHADIEITFDNPDSQLFQLGLAISDKSDWDYLFRPIDNKQINNLNWAPLKENGLILWQRKPKFNTINDFITSISSLKNVGIYDYQFDKKYRLNNYHPVATIQSINRTIRGYHQFYTYIKNEDLFFTFFSQDINRSKGPDLWQINVYDENNNKIFTKKINDDGMVTNLDPASPLLKTEVKIKNLPEGPYRVELYCEDEIFFRKIETTQQFMTFIDRIYLADNPEYSDGFVDLDYRPTELISTIKNVSFETAHPEGLQEVKINNQSIRLAETHKKYFQTIEKIPALIVSEKNDLKIIGRGLVSFSENLYFNPEIYNLHDFNTSADYDYLLTNYQPPVKEQNWQKAKINFSLSKAKITNRKLRWMLSAPDLNEQGYKIKIKNVKITYYKEPLSWQEIMPKFFDYLKKFL